MHHNEVRDLEAELFRLEVRQDCQHTDDGARADVSARDLRSPMDKAFVDIRTMHPRQPIHSRASTVNTKMTESSK